MIVKDEESEELEPFFDATNIHIRWGLSFVEYGDGTQEIECRHGLQIAQ
jgi:hypothetical protein